MAASPSCRWLNTTGAPAWHRSKIPSMSCQAPYFLFERHYPATHLDLHHFSTVTKPTLTVMTDICMTPTSSPFSDDHYSRLLLNSLHWRNIPVSEQPSGHSGHLLWRWHCPWLLCHPHCFSPRTQHSDQFNGAITLLGNWPGWILLWPKCWVLTRQFELHHSQRRQRSRDRRRSWHYRKQGLPWPSHNHISNEGCCFSLLFKPVNKGSINLVQDARFRVNNSFLLTQGTHGNRGRWKGV